MQPAQVSPALTADPVQWWRDYGGRLKRLQVRIAGETACINLNHSTKMWAILCTHISHILWLCLGCGPQGAVHPPHFLCRRTAVQRIRTHLERQALATPHGAHADDDLCILQHEGHEAEVCDHQDPIARFLIMHKPHSASFSTILLQGDTRFGGPCC